jgi:hypothetical protein
MQNWDVGLFIFLIPMKVCSWVTNSNYHRKPCVQSVTHGNIFYLLCIYFSTNKYIKHTRASIWWTDLHNLFLGLLLTFIYSSETTVPYKQYLHLQIVGVSLKDGGSMFLQDTVIHLEDYIVSQPRKQKSQK